MLKCHKNAKKCYKNVSWKRWVLHFILKESKGLICIVLIFTSRLFQSLGAANEKLGPHRWGHKFLAKAGRKHLQGCVLRKPVGSPRNTQNLWNQGCPFRCKKRRFSSHPRKTVSNLRALLEHSPDIDKDKHGWQIRRYHGKLVPCTLSPCNLLGWSAIRPKLSASITMVSYKRAYNHIWSKRLFKHATES